MIRATLLSLAWLASGFALAQPATVERIEGIALRLPERTEVYRELHEISLLAHRIEYRAPDGTPIADKTLDYRCSQTAPAFEQRDLRSGTRIGARWDDGRYRLHRDEESRTLASAQPLVSSSGFDRFVREHWEELLRGQRIDFEFALPARLQSLRLTIRRTAAPQTLPGTALWLRVVPAQALLRAFVDPIVLAYDPQRRLRLYRGVSNLGDADGGSLSVEISYARVLPDAPAGSAMIAAMNAVVPAATEPAAPAGRTSVNSACAESRS